MDKSDSHMEMMGHRQCANETHSTCYKPSHPENQPSRSREYTKETNLEHFITHNIKYRKTRSTRFNGAHYTICTVNISHSSEYPFDYVWCVFAWPIKNFAGHAGPQPTYCGPRPGLKKY